MDNRHPALEAAGLPVPGPHWDPPPELPDGFFPLRLVLRPGGFVVDLTRPQMVFGRHSDADVRLPLPDISRRHCRFVFEGGGWKVQDLSSLNGLYVNGERVAEAVLKQDDVVRVGGFLFTADVRGDDLPAGNAGRNTAGIVLRDIANALAPRRAG
jgi:predicted component of type VI protein secretion system